MEALCDECKRVFTIRPKTGREGDIETTFFECSHCRQRYLVCKTGLALRRLQALVEHQRQRNRERRKRGELNKRHIGHMMRKVRLLGEGLEKKNRT